MQLFILLFLLSHVAVVTAVTGCLSDRDKDHRPRENCTAAGFTGVPSGFEPSTKVLLFPNNQFSGLSWSSFQFFVELYEIDLTGNKVPAVTPSTSPILPSLSVLRLVSNRLTSLPDGAFTACPGLTELHLDRNAIDSLTDNTFSGLSKLEILDLSSNRIKVLPELMLHPLPAIETLLLEYNKINVMPDNWFSKKEEVPYLYLSDNPWACSCSLDYLRVYLDNYAYNVYTRDGPIISNNPESVVCDSPPNHKGSPVLDLKESDLCEPELGPVGDFYQPMTTMSSWRQPITTDAAIHTPTASLTFPTTTNPTTTNPTTTNPTTTNLPTTTTTSTTNPSATTMIDTTAAARAPTSAATAAFVKELHTTYYNVVTWSWYHSFTRVVEWSDYSGSVARGEATRSSLRTVRPSTESPVNMTSAPPTRFVETTRFVPPIASSTLQRAEVGARGAAAFCFWLFVGCLLLCVASAACILITLAYLLVWYWRVYKPLSAMLARRGRGGEGVRMVTYSRREGKEEAGGAVMPLFRSVLFIHREGGEAMEEEDVGKEAEEAGGKGRVLVPLEPTGGGGGGGETRGREERGVYRKALYRLVSKEEEIEGWRDVMEEYRISAEDGGGKDEGMERERRGRGGGGVGAAAGVTKKSYSVILREEREEAGGGKEELDWVVGGWEVKRGGGGEEEPRSSWGEWLAHYLPSMPWGVTTPAEGEAAQ